MLLKELDVLTAEAYLCLKIEQPQGAVAPSAVMYEGLAASLCMKKNVLIPVPAVRTPRKFFIIATLLT